MTRIIIQKIFSYEVLKKFADWAVDGTSNLTDAQMQSMLGGEYGVMNEILRECIEITGDEKIFDTVKKIYSRFDLNPLYKVRTV